MCICQWRGPNRDSVVKEGSDDGLVGKEDSFLLLSP